MLPKGKKPIHHHKTENGPTDKDSSAADKRKSSSQSSFQNDIKSQTTFHDGAQFSVEVWQLVSYVGTLLTVIVLYIHQMESEACGVWTPCEVKMKKVQRKKATQTTIIDDHASQETRNSCTEEEDKKRLLAEMKASTTIQDLKTQPYSIGILTQEAYRRSTYWKAK